MAGSSDSSGNWLMTYADFITLMMIFFIVLYTFTPGVEQSRFEAIIGVFQGKRGVLSFDSVVRSDYMDLEVERAKNWDGFLKYVQGQGLSEEVQVELMPDGIRITLGEAVTFDTYSAGLRKEAKEILQKIGRSLKSYTAENLDEIEVQGHTDNRPIRKNARLYKTNWELGAARATSVLEFIVDNSDIAARYFKASTYGEHHPRADNSTDRGRRQNRRIVIYIKYKKDSEAPLPEKYLTEELKLPKLAETNDGKRASTARGNSGTR